MTRRPRIPWRWVAALAACSLAIAPAAWTSGGRVAPATAADARAATANPSPGAAARPPVVRHDRRHRTKRKQTPEQRNAAILRAVFPDEADRDVVTLARCESSLQADHVNPEKHYGSDGRVYVGSWGLLQIAAIHTWAYKRSPRELLNPWRNARAALKLYRQAGGSFRQAWVACSRRWGLR